MALFRGRRPYLSKYTTPPSGFAYDVFLSFRGEDTRKTFTDHLYTALVNAGFHTFRDDPELERGENIKEKLEKAIQQSRSSVIVFSKDYTYSRWCLDELVMILERKRTSDHVVLPVFYDVDPFQLRKQAETLAKVPKYHEGQSSDKLNGWRAALREVADLAGMVLKNETDGYESIFIQNVVTVVQEKLARVPLSDVQELLQKKLRSTNDILDAAEGKQLNNPTVKDWLIELKEAVYDAEDLLQEIKTEALRQKMESGCSTSKVQEFILSRPSNAFDSALIYPRVEEVLERLESIMEQRKYVSSMEANGGYMLPQTLASTSLVEDSGVCGRDDEKETLVRLLLSDDECGRKISVIPIVGMGGIGKTTLAQLLYNDVRVKEHFDIKVWTCVSEKFNVFQTSQQIFESLTGGACNFLSFNVIQEKIEAALMGKKFLLVLDDVWNKNHGAWEVLMRPFQLGAHGCKIIVTTRNQEVASMVRSLEAHCLMPMSEEDGWSLFKKHAFKNTGMGGQSHLEKIGRQIVQKCKGLPLAIKSLGGLLCSKSNADKWETILNSEMWELPQEESEILPSLWLSYKYLPLELKRCFAYCSIFPKNYMFEGSELIMLWKVVGLLQPGDKKSAEKIGRDYFNDLISRSFFQHLSTYDVIYYTMHDLINDLASFISGEFCVRWEGNDSPKILSKTRHFSYIPHHAVDGLQIFEALQHAKCLHTILPLRVFGRSTEWWGKRVKGLHELLPRLQCLRALDLSSYDMEELPDSINILKHLKQLDLSYSSIRKLPGTVCTLYNLQILLLYHCESLAELPIKLVNLINLSHLDIRDTPQLKAMPPQMGRLKDLEMLPKFLLDKNTAKDNLPELKKLQNLCGGLHISGLMYSSGLEDYILRDKMFLKEVRLDWGRERFDLEPEFEERKVLEKLQPPLNLERLRIDGYGGEVLPGWGAEYYFSSALVCLTLEDCRNCVSLPPLGQLPFLRELCINGLYKVLSIGSEFYYGDGNTTTCVNKEPFRSLQSLMFVGMERLKEWSFVGGDVTVCFPKLTKLHVWVCRNLSKWPEQVYTLQSLLDLQLSCLPELECFPEDGIPSKLKLLEIRCCKEMKAKSLRRFTSLERLVLDYSESGKVDWFAPVDELFPSSLTYLELKGLKCETIDGAKWFGHLNSLHELRIMDWLELQSLPELPCSLQILEIDECPKLQCWPESGLPTALRTLTISYCIALQCLPDSGLPSSLSSLEIVGSPLLQKWCQFDMDEDWPSFANFADIDYAYVEEYKDEDEEEEYEENGDDKLE